MEKGKNNKKISIKIYFLYEIFIIFWFFSLFLIFFEFKLLKYEHFSSKLREKEKIEWNFKKKYFKKSI